MKRSLFIPFLLLTAGFLRAQVPTESLAVNWEPEYNLKKVKDPDNPDSGSLYIPKNETPKKYSLVVSVNAFHGEPKDMPTIFEKFRKGFDSSTLITELQKKETKVNPFIIARVEQSVPDSAGQRKSDLYYLLRGRTTLFIVYVETGKDAFTQAFVNKWISIFRRSQIVYQ